MGASWTGSARALISSGISLKCLTICSKDHFVNMFVILSRIPCVMWASGLMFTPHDIPLGALEDISQGGILSHFPLSHVRVHLGYSALWCRLRKGSVDLYMFYL